MTIELSKGGAPEPEPEETAVELLAPDWLRRRIEAVTDRQLWPGWDRLGATLLWYGRTALRVGAWVLTHPWVLLSELRPIGRGLMTVADAWSAWLVSRTQEENVKAGEGDVRTKHGEFNEQRREGRRRFSFLVVFVVLGGSVWLGMTGRGDWLIAAGIAAVVALDVVGRRVRAPAPATATLPRSPLCDGTPLYLMADVITDTLTAHGHVPKVAEGRVIPHGASFQLHSAMEVTDEEIAACERALQGFPGSVARIQDKTNAAIGELRIMWEDPLDRLVPAPHYAPRSQTVTVPGFAGIGWNGEALRMNFLRTNLIIVGGTGSGKSEVANTFTDYITACDDAVLDVIDLSAGPYGEAWGDAVRYLATTEKEAEELLRDSIERAKRRTRQISGRARPTRDGGPAVPGSANWDPRTDGGPQHIVAVDELPLMVRSAVLRDLLTEHQRIGRKAAENSWCMTQDSSGDTIKSTSLRKYPSVTIMLSCSREDVIGLLGGGMLKAGWRPDRLSPAEGDNPNDAGKGYVWGGAFRTALPYRFAYLGGDVGPIWSRVRERLELGFPALEDDPHRGDTIEGHVVPEPLASVAAVFAAAGDPERISSEQLLIALAAHGQAIRTKRALAAALEPQGLRPRDKRWMNEGTYVRGYWLADVRAAVEGTG